MILGCEERSKCSLSEELCGNAVFTNIGYVYEKQAQIGFVSSCDMSSLCQPEDIFSSKLALLSRHLFATLEEQRPKDVPGRLR